MILRSYGLESPAIFCDRVFNQAGSRNRQLHGNDAVFFALKTDHPTQWIAQLRTNEANRYFPFGFCPFSCIMRASAFMLFLGLQALAQSHTFSLLGINIRLFCLFYRQTIVLTWFNPDVYSSCFFTQFIRPCSTSAEDGSVDIVMSDRLVAPPRVTANHLI
jgi:hypothetical protein